MTERVKPKVVGTVTGRTQADKPNKSNEPKSSLDIGTKRQQGLINDGYGQPVSVAEFGGLKITYRARSAEPSGAEHRRYYIGYVQFAFVSVDPRGPMIVHLTGQDDAPQGIDCVSETELLVYLKKQLVLK